MKKVLALILSLVMMLSLMPFQSAFITNANAVYDDTLDVSVFWYDFADAYLSTVRDELSYKLSSAGFNFTNYDAARSQANQNKQIRTAIAEGTDLLVVNIVDTASENAAQTIVNLAKNADIPVIFFNREISDSVINSYKEACYIGTRAAEAGEKQGIMAGEYIVLNYDAVDLNNDGEISYIMMKGELGHPEAESRTKESIEYANEVLTSSGKPELKYYDRNNKDLFQPSNWSWNDAFNLMETALGTNPMDSKEPIEVVFANNDDAALGCIEALNNKGWNTGDEPFIPVFGIDCTNDAVNAIKHGQMTGTILESAKGLAEAITTLAQNVADGENVFANARDMFNVDPRSAKIRVPYEIVTVENVDYPDDPDYPDFPEYDDFNVSIFWYDFADAYLSTVRWELENALENWGINNYVQYDAARTQAWQNEQIDNAIAQGTDLLIVNIVDTASPNHAQAIVNKAKRADIPVIFFNREVSDDVINSYDEACFVGTRVAEAGELQGMIAGTYIAENYDEIDLNKDGNISYIMMKGELGHPESEARTLFSIKFANSILNEAGKPDLKYYDRSNTDLFQPADWSKFEAFNLMETALGTNPMDGSNPIEVVFANNDDMALGCIEALNNKGWNTGYDSPSIPVFGIDSTADAQIAINTGKMTDTIYVSASDIAYTITYLADNVHYGSNVFDYTDNFNVDDSANKIRVPYTAYTNGDDVYPDFPEPGFPDYDIPDLNEGDVAVFWYNYNDAFLSNVRDSLNDELYRSGIGFVDYNAKSTQAVQDMQIRSAIEQGASLLVVNIVDTAAVDAAQNIADMAKKADIPVIFFNREVVDEVINSYYDSCFVGTRAAQAGEMQGIMAGEYIVKHYDEVDLNKDGKISYIMMKGELGNPEAEARTNESVAFTNAILEEAGKPKLKYYDKYNTDLFQPSNWSKTQAFDLMETALGTNPMDGKEPIEVVFANNDDAALGCIEALHNVGWNTGYENDPFIPVFGIDCTADAIAAMQAGKMTGTVLQSSEGMAEAVHMLIKNVHGGKHVFYKADEYYPVDDYVNKIRVPYEIITQEAGNYPEYSPSYASKVKGDVNGDYEVSNIDLILIARFIVELEDDLPSFKNADVNRDGKITNADLVATAIITISGPADRPNDGEVNAGVFWYNFADAYLSTVRCAMDFELEESGINFTNYDAASNQWIQNDQIDTAISQGANLLIVNIVDTASDDAAQAIVNKARKANIPVIFFNREVSDYVINSYDDACFVGTRAAEAGEMQGFMAGEYIVANFDAIDLNKDGKISYIMMKGELGNPEAEARTRYSVEFCNAELREAGYPALTFYDSRNYDRFMPANWSKTEAFNLMETALGTNPMDGENPIEVVFANNDDMALGCIEALNNAGWNTGDKDDPFIPVFGIDYILDAMEAIEAGKMTGSILQSATGMAETVAALAANVANNEHVFANTDGYNIDDNAAKIRVPYEIKA